LSPWTPIRAATGSSREMEFIAGVKDEGGRYKYVRDLANG